jgi:hypothetical protein
MLDYRSMLIFYIRFIRFQHKTILMLTEWVQKSLRMLHINFNAQLSYVPYVDTFHANHVIQMVTWLAISKRDQVVAETMKLVCFILSLIRTVRLQTALCCG